MKWKKYIKYDCLYQKFRYTKNHNAISLIHGNIWRGKDNGEGVISGREKIRERAGERWRITEEGDWRGKVEWIGCSMERERSKWEGGGLDWRRGLKMEGCWKEKETVERGRGLKREGSSWKGKGVEKGMGLKREGEKGVEKGGEVDWDKGG